VPSTRVARTPRPIIRCVLFIVLSSPANSGVHASYPSTPLGAQEFATSMPRRKTMRTFGTSYRETGRAGEPSRTLTTGFPRLTRVGRGPVATGLGRRHNGAQASGAPSPGRPIRALCLLIPPETPDRRREALDPRRLVRFEESTRVLDDLIDVLGRVL